MRNNKAYFSKQTAYSTEIVEKTVPTPTFFAENC